MQPEGSRQILGIEALGDDRGLQPVGGEPGDCVGFQHILGAGAHQHPPIGFRGRRFPRGDEAGAHADQVRAERQGAANAVGLGDTPGQHDQSVEAVPHLGQEGKRREAPVVAPGAGAGEHQPVHARLDGLVREAQGGDVVYDPAAPGVGARHHLRRIADAAEDQRHPGALHARETLPIPWPVDGPGIDVYADGGERFSFGTSRRFRLCEFIEPLLELGLVLRIGQLERAHDPGAGAGACQPCGGHEVHGSLQQRQAQVGIRIHKWGQSAFILDKST